MVGRSKRRWCGWVGRWSRGVGLVLLVRGDTGEGGVAMVVVQVRAWYCCQGGRWCEQQMAVVQVMRWIPTRHNTSGSNHFFSRPVLVPAQVGLPSDTDQYIHRVGRTARGGATGTAVLLLADFEARKFIAQLQQRQLPIKTMEPCAEYEQYEARMEAALSKVRVCAGV